MCYNYELVQGHASLHSNLSHSNLPIFHSSPVSIRVLNHRWTSIESPFKTFSHKPTRKLWKTPKVNIS